MTKVFVIRGDKQKETAIDEIRQIIISDKLMTVEIKPFVKSRTLAQNRLIHMWFGIIAKETGNDLETVKAYYKAKFLGYEFRTITFNGKAKAISELKSTADLNTKEMSEFANSVDADCANELGIVLPKPEDLIWSILENSNGEDPLEP